MPFCVLSMMNKVKCSLSLMVPVLIPSWRFFDEIAPSPRIEFSFLDDSAGEPSWEVFTASVERVSLLQGLKRMFYNGRWNEGLFMVSCAERLMNAPTQHSEDEIYARLIRNCPHKPHAKYIKFRLVFIYRDEQGELARYMAYDAKPRAIEGELL